MEPRVRALFFDVFGTLVDWRSGIAREAESILGGLGYRLDWLGLADAWRSEYEPALERVRTGASPFLELDIIHRQNLERILPRFDVRLLDIDSATLDLLNHAWHRLDAWPDAEPGLARLRREFLLAPVSNGNIANMVALARRNGFVWDAVLGAELAEDYKPKRRVYERACEALDLPPAACMMVAAHPYDLVGAGAVGMRTGYVARPHEHGPAKSPPVVAETFDMTASSILDLAQQLGA